MSTNLLFFFFLFLIYLNTPIPPLIVSAMMIKMMMMMTSEMAQVSSGRSECKRSQMQPKGTFANLGKFEFNDLGPSQNLLKNV